MSVLSNYITVEPRNVRAVNLESDLGSGEVLRGFSAGAHVIDATRQIVTGLQDGARSRAWSITGPYGAGKSTFAIFLAALFGDAGDPAQTTARRLLRGVDRQLADVLARERKRVGLAERAIIPALAVARREPTALALSRALLFGATRATASRRGRKPGYVHDLADAVERRTADPELVFRATEELAELGPLLIVVDELGKTLEYAADGSGEADLYLLQQLAERFSGAQTFGGAVITLQHLAFEDYLVGAGDARRREWRKVHGRFDDIPFVPDRDHGVTLVAEAMRLAGADDTLKKRIRRECSSAEAALTERAPHVAPPSASTGQPDATYPLHAVAALALPVLAARLGQHDRSLVAFLAGDSPASMRSLLDRLVLVDGEDLPFVRTAHLYEFFFADGAATALGTANGARLREIAARVDGAAELDPLALEVLKTVAVLNIVAGRDMAPASAPVITEAVVGPTAHASRRAQIACRIEALQERGLLTYREFASEYRIWQGSDFDITAATAAAREQLSLCDVDDITLRTIAEARPLRPLVAQRYSQTHQVLRFFEARFSRSAEDLAQAVPALDGADGLVLYVLGDATPPAKVPAACPDGRPLIVVWSPAGRQLSELALDLAAARQVLEHAPELEGDAVARQELRFRVATLRDHLVDAVDEGFDPRAGERVCFVSGRRKGNLGAAEFSTLLSRLCEKRFPSTPVIRNEMINRGELTSQGAKARRELLERIFTHADAPRLGIEGFGPERAMYEAVLRYTGMHRERRGWWAFVAPDAESPLFDVWEAVMAFFDAATHGRRPLSDLYTELKAPPYGLKDGPIPVILSVALQYRNDDVFVYQDGSFQPSIDAATVERLLKAPDRFTVKRAALLGIRAVVFERLRELVEETPAGSAATRNASTLAVVRPLITFVRELPAYATRTESVSPRARAVCQVLLAATEPDELLFAQLPAACELGPITESLDAPARSEEFVTRLRAALVELGSCYERLLDQIAGLLREAFAVPGDGSVELREHLRVRSSRLVANVIDPHLRGFLLIAGDRELDDSDWLEAIAMGLTSKPATSWGDHDVIAFEALLAERAAWFGRLEDLYFERLRRADETFDARRVTITAPDGSEASEIVSIDKVAHEVAGSALAPVLAELGSRLGAQRARAALIGALVGDVHSESTTTGAEPETPRAAKRARRSPA